MNCESYCSHGGVCELEAGHEGLHDSRYCKWTDAESIPRAEANAILAASGPVGALIAEMDEALRGES